MTLAVGTEVYNADSPPVVARGATINEDELGAALAGSVHRILWDTVGKANLEATLASVATTAFATEGVRRILSMQAIPENWRVGEAIAEAYLCEHRKCSFPWRPTRDLKNPRASQAGTDLVGFQVVAGSGNMHCFAFGEIKTSEEEVWPPSVMSGSGGLRSQLEDLRDCPGTRDALVIYLGHHAEGSEWRPFFRSAAERYLNDAQDVSIFGLLIRDVEPKAADLSGTAASLSRNCTDKSRIELLALYLPQGAIPTLSERATKAREGIHGSN